jgi:beta-N-acetylhexosaminidase
VEEAAEPHEAFIHKLRRYHLNTLFCSVGVKPTEVEVRKCVDICRNADVVVVVTYNLHQYIVQKDFVHMLLGLGKPAVVAAVRDPYDLAFVPEARACVATYSFRQCSLKALAGVLFGQVEATGELPVELG